MKAVLGLESFLVEFPATVWIVIALLVAFFFLFGISTLIVSIAWILIMSLTAFAMAYSIGVALDCKSVGFQDAKGKLQAFGCMVAAVLIFILTQINPLAKPSNENATSTKTATLEYWNSLASILDQGEKAQQRFNVSMTQSSTEPNPENPFDVYRKSLLAMSKEIGRLPIRQVDPIAVELGIELDELLIEVISLVDNLSEFVKEQFTVGGLMKALFLGTQAEEATMNEHEKRISDRALEWNQKQISVRATLSSRFGVTLPPLVAPK